MPDFMEQIDKVLNVYEFEGSLVSNENTKFTFIPMDIAQLKRVLTIVDDEEKLEEVLDEILVTNVKVNGKPINPDDLYVEDRFWIFFNMRLKSRGEVLEINTKCPNDKCNKIIEFEMDLTKLDVTQGKSHAKSCRLNDQLVLVLDYISRKDSKIYNNWLKVEYDKIEDKEDKSKNKELQFDSAMALYASMIRKVIINDASTTVLKDKALPKKTVLEDLSIDDKMHLVSRLSDIDYNKIKEWYEDNWFGVKLQTKIKCPLCQHEETQEVNVGNFF